jgi:hypothetical protein
MKQNSILAISGNIPLFTTPLSNSSQVTSMHSKTSPVKVLQLGPSLTEVGAGDSTSFWLNHPIRWVQVIGIIVALTQKEKADIILRMSP